MLTKALNSLQLIAAAAAISFAFLYRYDGSFEVYIQAALLGAAAMFALPCLWSKTRDSKFGFSLTWLIALCAYALALRYLALQIFPPAVNPAHEELQTGGIAFHMVNDMRAQFDLRFTNVMAALGFLWKGPNMQGLRAATTVAGYLCLCLLALCMRQLRVGKVPTFLVLSSAASMPWFVMGSVVAYENETPFVFWLCCFYALLRAQNTKIRADAWYALAAIFNGILLYEFSAFKSLAAFNFVLVFLIALKHSRAQHSFQEAVLHFTLFSICTCIVAFPIFIDVVELGKNSLFFDSFVRHAKERSGFLSPVMLSNLRSYAAGLFGLSEGFWPFAAPEPGTGVTNPISGALLFLALIYSLFAFKSVPICVLAWATVFSITAAAGGSNNVNYSRISAFLPVLHILLGVFLQHTLAKIDSCSDKFNRVFKLQLHRIAIILLSVWLSLYYFDQMRAIMKSPFSLKEYSNNSYALAHAVGWYPRRNSSPIVVVLGINGTASDWYDSRWLWEPQGIKPIVVNNLDKLFETDLCIQTIFVIKGAFLKPGDKGEFLRLGENKAAKNRPFL